MIKKMLLYSSSKKGGNFMNNILDMDLYEILEVDPLATQPEIKKAYHQIVKKYHPDNAGYNQEKWLNIQRAYEILSDEQSRVDYNDKYCAKHGSFKKEMQRYQYVDPTALVHLYEEHQERKNFLNEEYARQYYKILVGLYSDVEIQIIDKDLEKLSKKDVKSVLDSRRLAKQKKYLQQRKRSIKNNYLEEIKELRRKLKDDLLLEEFEIIENIENLFGFTYSNQSENVKQKN